MSEDKILLKIKKEDTKITYEDFLNAYNRVPGVWYLIGREKGSEEFVYLEVAETNNVLKELKENLAILIGSNVSFGRVVKREYKARTLFDFSKRFMVKVNENRRSAKYRDIIESYEELIFYLVKDSNLDKKERLEREMIIAVDNKAIYWNAYGNQRKMTIKRYKGD